MRLSFFEGLMLVAVFALLFCVIVPRISDSLPEVRAARANALAARLDALTAQWLNAGGLMGPGQPDRLILTRHLLLCFASPRGVLFTSPHDSSPVNYVGEPSAAAAAFRVPELSRAQFTSGYLPSGLKAVFISRQFAAVYDGARWQVWPAQ